MAKHLNAWENKRVEVKGSKSGESVDDSIRKYDEEHK